jgi:putative RNA 2'-phosphotransferase
MNDQNPGLENPGAAPDLTKISKYMSYVLRHRPDAAGLRLDPQGWVYLDALIAGLNAAGLGVDETIVRQVVAQSDKKRFTLSQDGTRLRAAQGHSTAGVDPDHPVVAPPETLYHGTVERFLPAILAEGLKPGSRLVVHLSPDVATARVVGARRGAPIVLAVAAGAMARAGHQFRLSENGVWLIEAVPPVFLSRLPEG